MAIEPNTLEELSAFGSPAWLSSVDVTKVPTSPLEVLGTTFANIIVAASRDAAAKFALIADHPDFSPEGKRRRRAEVAEGALAELSKKVGPRIGQVRVEIASRLAKMDDRTEQTAADAIYDVATWSYLPSDPLAIENTYRSAIEAGDLRTARAIETMPVVHKGRLAPDRLTALRSLRLAAEHPQEAAAVAQLERALADTERAARIAESQIRRAGGLPPSGAIVTTPTLDN